MTTAIPDLENALNAVSVEDARPDLDLEAPDLIGAWRDAEERARAYRSQEIAKAIVHWSEAHLHTADDRREFLSELATALSQNDMEGFRDTLQAWVRTAKELSDPDTREVLLGQHSEADFEDVARPE